MLCWDRDFTFTEEQRASIRELLPEAAINPDKFMFNIEIAAQAYRGIAQDWYTDGLELKPYQYRPILLRISKKAINLRQEINSLRPLSGRALVEGKIYDSDLDQRKKFKLEKLCRDLEILAYGASEAHVSSKDFGPIIPEKFLARTIKRDYKEYISPPGSSRNCPCYKIVGLVLNYSGKHIDDWYHHYHTE